MRGAYSVRDSGETGPSVDLKKKMGSKRYHVVKTQNAASLSWPAAGMNCINGSLWVLYGAALSDPFIYVSNGLGALLGLIQLSLLALYSANTARHKAAAGGELPDHAYSVHRDHDHHSVTVAGALELGDRDRDLHGAPSSPGGGGMERVELGPAAAGGLSAPRPTTVTGRSSGRSSGRGGQYAL